jgi:hypothetical protein
MGDLAAPVAAQTVAPSSGIQLETGLHTFFSGTNRFIQVTVTELGGTDVTSTVRVTFFDANDRPIFRDGGTLERGRPVRLELPLAMAQPRVQLRATIRISGLAGRNTAPAVVVEDVDPLSLTIGTRISCAPPIHRQGPVEPYCPEVVATSFVVP